MNDKKVPSRIQQEQQESAVFYLFNLSHSNDIPKKKEEKHFQFIELLELSDLVFGRRSRDTYVLNYSQLPHNCDVMNNSLISFS